MALWLSPRHRVRNRARGSGYSHCSFMSRGASCGDLLLRILGDSLWSFFCGPCGSSADCGLSFLAKDTKLVTRPRINGRKGLLANGGARILRADVGEHTGSLKSSFTQTHDHHTQQKRVEKNARACLIETLTRFPASTPQREFDSFFSIRL